MIGIIEDLHQCHACVNCHAGRGSAPECRHESISNMTGNTSLLGIALGTAGAGGLGHGVYRQYSLARGIPVT